MTWPPTGPCSRDASVLSPDHHEGGRAVDAFLGFSPPERSPQPSGRSLVVAMPALSSLGGMTSLPTWTSGLRGADGSAWSVSGLPALLGLCTLRPSRHSVHRPGERAHAFASRRTSRMTRDANSDPSSLADDAAKGPRPPTRCRRPAVRDWTHRPTLISGCRPPATIIPALLNAEIKSGPDIPSG
jgi:hypothetical protein